MAGGPPVAPGSRRTSIEITPGARRAAIPSRPSCETPITAVPIGGGETAARGTTVAPAASTTIAAPALRASRMRSPSATGEQPSTSRRPRPGPITIVRAAPPAAVQVASVPSSAIATSPRLAGPASTRSRSYSCPSKPIRSRVAPARLPPASFVSTTQPAAGASANAQARPEEPVGSPRARFQPASSQLRATTPSTNPR